MKKNINMKTISVEQDWTCKCGYENHMHIAIPFGYLNSYDSIDVACVKCGKAHVCELIYTEEELQKLKEDLDEKLEMKHGSTLK